MTGRGPGDRRYLSYVVVLILLAAFTWSLLRAWSIVQDHRRNDPPAAAT